MREKIGQMIMTGFRGQDSESARAVRRQIREGLCGGVVLFDRDFLKAGAPRNIESPRQVRELVAGLQGHAPIPLLVAVDQEGGKVRRLKMELGFPDLPAARELGVLDDTEATARWASETASMLAQLGINLNLAPVVDLDINPENPVIGSYGRSFSIDPRVVERQARAFISAHREKRVATSLKHFPGHGSSTADSHLELPDISRTWKKSELRPYRSLIRSGHADCVMTAHVYHSRLDPDFPATLSHRIVSGLLRDQLGFAGVVISDDLDMKAITENFGLERAIALAVNAGIDILTFGNNLVYDEEMAAKAMEIIENLVRNGSVPSERIEESCQRILLLKESVGLL